MHILTGSRASGVSGLSACRDLGLAPMSARLGVAEIAVTFAPVAARKALLSGFKGLEMLTTPMVEAIRTAPRHILVRDPKRKCPRPCTFLSLSFRQPPKPSAHRKPGKHTAAGIHGSLTKRPVLGDTHTKNPPFAWSWKGASSCSGTSAQVEAMVLTRP